MKQKYVRLKKYNQFIFFPETLNHSDFNDFDILSAGFCTIEDNNVICYGESFSLRLKSNDDDSFLATRQLFGDDKF